MGLLEDLREQAGISKNSEPTKVFLPVSGQFWVKMKVEFDTDGKGKILQSYIQPVKDGNLNNKTPKKREKKMKIEKSEKESTLF